MCHTRNKNTSEIDIDGNLFILFGVQANGYGGSGFYLLRAWTHRREAEAQVRSIMDGRAERGRAIRAAQQEFEDHQNERNTERDTVMAEPDLSSSAAKRTTKHSI